jgi:hypothetical protein
VRQGKEAVAEDAMDRLRHIVYLLDSTRVGPPMDDAMLAESNLVRQ